MEVWLHDFEVGEIKTFVFFFFVEGEIIRLFGLIIWFNLSEFFVVFVY